MLEMVRPDMNQVITKLKAMITNSSITTENLVLSNEQQFNSELADPLSLIVENLSDWITYGFTWKDLFIGLNDKTLQSLIIDIIMNNPEADNNKILEKFFVRSKWTFGHLVIINTFSNLDMDVKSCLQKLVNCQVVNLPIFTIETQDSIRAFLVRCFVTGYLENLGTIQINIFPQYLMWISMWILVEKFSDKTINLLSSSVDNRSSRTVSSAIRVWEHWCDSQHVDPVTCPINKICEFFSDMLTFGKSYNTIAGYRSAISEIHERIDNFSIGTHPDILKAMQAIRIDKPPTSKSDDAIDIIPSLEFIVSLGDNSTMSIRELTCKTAFLLALISACRP
ncbi:hypothetical protein GLOIN_2v1786700, partial [Rhizophagus irregularis DAOM 181602=DAOM 197198]